MINEKTKRGLSVAYIFITIALVFVLGIWMGDIGASWQALTSLQPVWVLAAFCCWFLYVAGRALALKFFCARQGLPIRAGEAWRIAMIGQYYSGITPAATGGQPMQIYELNKCGVPVGVGSSAMIVKFICFQVALLLLGGGMWLFYAKQISVQLEGLLWFVRLGFGINLFWTALLLLILVKQSIVAWLMRIVLLIGRKLRWIRDPERFSARVDAQLTEFHRVLEMLVHRPLILVVMLSLAFFQVLSYMSAVYCLYRGFGQSGISPGFIITVQLLLFLAVSFMPMPGASGAQEGGFVLFFRGIFPEGSMFAALLAWRFFTYYLMLIVGGAVVVRSTFIKKRQRIPLPQKDAVPSPPCPEDRRD
jgi:uncharacterized protein (TIRG00374 family)